MNTLKDFKELEPNGLEVCKDVPKRYFLVSFRLPFFIGIGIKHADEIGFSKEDVKNLQKLMQEIKPQVVHFATEAKKIELELVKKYVEDGASLEEVEELVDRLAEVKTDMQKLHIICVNRVREVVGDKYDKHLEIVKKYKSQENDFKQGLDGCKK